MRAGFAGCFDIGYSYGVTDRVFDPARLGASTDISMVGIDNPFGRGVTLDLPPELIDEWRREASRQLDRPELEPGWDESWTDLPEDAFHAAVREVLAGYPVVARVTLYAIGIGYLRHAPGRNSRSTRRWPASRSASASRTPRSPPARRSS
jgi:hypothetical protein